MILGKKRKQRRSIDESSRTREETNSRTEVRAEDRGRKRGIAETKGTVGRERESRRLKVATTREVAVFAVAVVAA